MDCTIRVAKTKALISFAVTAKLICVFVFAYVKIRFSHDEPHIFAEPEVDIPSDFPFPFEPYNIQKGFMKEVYRCLELGKVGIFESPTGTVSRLGTF